MFVRVQAHELKPIMNVTAGEELVNGAPVAYAADGAVTKANAETDYVVVSAECWEGKNACIAPTDADFEKIEAGALCLRFPVEIGDVIATTEVEGAESLVVGDALVAKNGKFAKAGAGEHTYAFGGVYENPWNLKMYRVERMRVTTA